jgi:hypothetical protein
MRSPSSRFVLGSIGLLVLAILAFWPKYLSKPFGPIDSYTHFHAIIGALWLLLALAQAILISTGKHALHRSLGRLSLFIAPLFVVSAILLAHYRFSRMDARAFDREAYTLYLPLSAAVLFAAAFLLGLKYRANRALHARFMTCTLLLMIDPVLGRVLAFYVVQFPHFWHYQIITFGSEIATLAALAWSLHSSPADRLVFLRFGFAYSAVLLLWFFAPNSSAWHSWARWFAKLPLT